MRTENDANMSMRARRAACALLGCAAVFLAAVFAFGPGSTAGEEAQDAGGRESAAGTAAQAGRTQVDASSAGEARAAAKLILSGDARAAVALLAEGSSEGKSGLPSGFEDEVLVLSGVEDVHSDEAVKVVGWACPGNAEAVFRQLSAEMEARGWVAVESGSSQSGTFFKEEGAYRWVCLMCYQTGVYASIVVQYR